MHKNYNGIAKPLMEVLRNFNFEKSDNYYITCFSSDPDSLDLWRSYSKAETGISLEFSVKNNLDFPFFSTPPDIRLSKVIYDDELKSDYTKGIITNVLSEVEADLRKGIPYSEDHFDDIIKHIISPMRLYFSFFKHQSFSSEKEIRMIYQEKNETDFDNLHFRTSKMGLIPYYRSNEFILYDEDKKRCLAKNLPLEKITIGPTKYFTEITRSVSIYLQKMGYSDIEIVQSKVPFRE
jgi:hypothetical protein